MTFGGGSDPKSKRAPSSPRIPNASRTPNAPRTPSPLGDLIADALGAEVGMDLSRVALWWQSNVPERLREVSWPSRVDNQTLYVETTHSMWSQELTMVKRELLRTMKSALPDLRVRDIYIRVANSPDAQSRTSPP